MAPWYQSQCSMGRWMSLTARWRVPHPVRPKVNYGSKVLWSWQCPEISSYQFAKIGRYGQGLPPVMLNFEYPEAVMVETGSLKLFQNRPGPVQGKCCLKNVENFDLTLFWYSPTYQQNWILQKPAIFDLNHNSEGWIRACGFALFIVTKPHFSGLRFDNKIEDRINCIYPFGICNKYI